MLTQLMYKATMNDIWMKDRPDINLWAKIDELDINGLEQIMLLRRLNSNEPRVLPPPV